MFSLLLMSPTQPRRGIRWHAGE
ncbi:hypothetical protein A2U01_0096000, partial [Trifolium medium]|nr:hypothetical protein [Trifolium medium]